MIVNHHATFTHHNGEVTHVSLTTTHLEVRLTIESKMPVTQALTYFEGQALMAAAIQALWDVQDTTVPHTL